MPLARLALVLVAVIAAAAVTVALAALVAASFELPALGAAVALPVALALYLLVRVVADRMRSADDTRYDRIER